MHSTCDRIYLSGHDKRIFHLTPTTLRLTHTATLAAAYAPERTCSLLIRISDPIVHPLSSLDEEMTGNTFLSLSLVSVFLYGVCSLDHLFAILMFCPIACMPDSRLSAVPFGY